MASMATFLVLQSVEAINSINTGKNFATNGVNSYSTWNINEIKHSNKGVWALNEFKLITNMILSVSSSSSSLRTSSGLFYIIFDRHIAAPSWTVLLGDFSRRV